MMISSEVAYKIIKKVLPRPRLLNDKCHSFMVLVGCDVGRGRLYVVWRSGVDERGRRIDALIVSSVTLFSVLSWRRGEKSSYELSDELDAGFRLVRNDCRSSIKLSPLEEEILHGL